MYGPVVAFILFIIQAAIPAVPYVILAGAAGMIYGRLLGFLMAWMGAVAGACLLFYVSRFLARDFFVEFISRKYDLRLQDLDRKHIFTFILLARLLPIVPTPAINIGSAIGGISFREFFIPSLLGKIPWAIFYVCLGDYYMKTGDFKSTLLVIAASVVLSVILVHFFRKRMPFRKAYKESQGT